MVQGGRPLLNGIECLTWSSVDDATMGGAVRHAGYHGWS
jgi:hypothetical protein